MIGIFSSILFLFGMSFFILFLYSLTRQRNNLSAPFACMCLAISIYISGYVCELQSSNIEQISFALKAEYFGAPFMSGFWMLLSYKFLFKKTAPFKTVVFIMLLPVITLFLSVTNEYHHLIYTRIAAIQQDGYLLSQLSKGPWYYVNIGYAYCVQIFGMAVFFKAWRTKMYLHKIQAFWMFWGSIWPALVNLIYVAGLSPLDLDLTPFGLSISAVFFYIAIFRYGFLELQEIVKDVTFLGIEEGILVIDDKNRLIDFNQACKDIFSWLHPNQIGTNIITFPEGKAILEQTNQNHFEIKIRKGNAAEYYEFRRTPLIDRKTNLGFVYFIQNITKQKEMIQALNDIASYDSLTEIYNRRRLMEETEKELFRMKRYGNCLSLLMIDIDHFKIVNDQFGHQAGDEVLKSLANCCKEQIRRTDTIGRYGGEEFLIILPETNEGDALFIAENIRKSIEELEFCFNNEAISITVSIGIKTAYRYENNLNVEFIIKGADNAMYYAKNNGRNQVSSIS